MQRVDEKIPPSEVGGWFIGILCSGFWTCPVPTCLTQFFFFWLKAITQSKYVSRPHALYWEIMSSEMVSQEILRHSYTQVHFYLWEKNLFHPQRGITCKANAEVVDITFYPPIYQHVSSTYLSCAPRTVLRVGRGGTEYLFAEWLERWSNHVPQIPSVGKIIYL